MYVPPEELVVLRTPHWLVNQCVDASLPGYLIVSALDPAADRLAALSPEARQALGAILAEVEAALEDVLAPSRVYVARWGHTPGHTVHFHVVPVFPWIEEAARADPRYRRLLELHGPHGDGPEGEHDGVDLSLFVVRELLESASPPPVPGPAVGEVVARLRHRLAPRNA